MMEKSKLAKMRPTLKPCPCCGGRAEALDGEHGVYVGCMMCGIRTHEYMTPRGIGRNWNRRTERRARVLDLDELADAGCGMTDDRGNAAAWLETRDDGGLIAVLIGPGIDFGEATLDIMDDLGIWHTVPPEVIRQYRAAWRLWDICPGMDDIEREQWDDRIGE